VIKIIILILFLTAITISERKKKKQNLFSERDFALLKFIRQFITFDFLKFLFAESFKSVTIKFLCKMRIYRIICPTFFDPIREMIRVFVLEFTISIIYIRANYRAYAPLISWLINAN